MTVSRKALPTVAALTIGVAACRGRATAPRPTPGSVVFELAPVEARTPTRVAWLATHQSGGVTARFRIELEPEPKGTTPPTFVRCALIREPESDGRLLIRDLSRALGARRLPAPGRGVGALELTAALLGRNLSRGKGPDQIAGWYTSQPSGTWIATKLFLADDGGEVFLNLDPIGGYGEFSLKDEDYGDTVVRELSRLFHGEVSPHQAAPPPELAWSVSPPAPPLPSVPPNPDSTRVQQLMEQAGSGVPQPERWRALEKLAKMGAQARAALPVFLAALQDEDPFIRGAALQGLPAIRPEREIGILAVTPLLKDPLATNQVRAANALADFGETARAVNYLTVFLKGEAKTWAAAGLTRIGPEARDAVPHLVQMLEQRSDPMEGYAACRALAAIGRDAAGALPALRSAAADVDRSVREAAQYAIREIDGR